MCQKNQIKTLNKNNYIKKKTDQKTNLVKSPPKQNKMVELSKGSLRMKGWRRNLTHVNLKGQKHTTKRREKRLTFRFYILFFFFQLIYFLKGENKNESKFGKQKPS